MRWRGKTAQQRKGAMRKWHKIFCLWPIQIQDGSWVWLETIWCRAVDTNVNGRFYWEYSASVNQPSEVHLKGAPPNPRR